MAKEIEQPRFRPGESAKWRYGGNISDEPLPQALYNSAISRGFESQSALAKTLGIAQSAVGSWYKGKRVPSPEVFGDLLVLLDQTDEEREPLVEAYANSLAKREKSSKLKISRNSMRSSNSPLDKWTKDFCEREEITIDKFSQILRFNSKLNKRRFSTLGLINLEHIRQNAKEALGLSEEQSATLNEAIDNEIERKKEEGHRFQSGPSGSVIVKKQKELNYRTYNGQQAGEKLGISRERVRQLRKDYNLPVLLTDEHIEMLMTKLEKTSTFREKLQQTRKEVTAHSSDTKIIVRGWKPRTENIENFSLTLEE